jgi:hypothetical protein
MVAYGDGCRFITVKTYERRMFSRSLRPHTLVNGCRFITVKTYERRMFSRSLRPHTLVNGCRFITVKTYERRMFERASQKQGLEQVSLYTKRARSKALSRYLYILSKPLALSMTSHA